jgi:hypothetical protein
MIAEQPEMTLAEIREAIEEMPANLRTGAAVSPTVGLIMPNKVALHLARRIEDGRRPHILEVPIPRPDTRAEVFWKSCLLGVGAYSLFDLVAQYVLAVIQ